MTTRMISRAGSKLAHIGKLTVLFVLALSLTACANAGPKTAIGAATGAAAGGLIGAAAGGGTEGIVAGVLLGGLVGGAIGNALDQRDKELLYKSQQNALETYRVGETSTWRNPDSGNYGTIQPTNTYQTESGQYCREYQQTITVGGQTEEAFGKACRQPDGSWRVVQ